MNWRPLLFGIIGLAISAALIYFAKPLAELLLSGFGIQSEETRPRLANTITATPGSYYRKAGHGSFSPLKPDHTLHQRDEVKTERGAKVHLKFNSGYEIEILEESQAILDIWSSQNDRKPGYISFIRGNFRLLQKGEPGQLYIVLNDDVFAPEQRPVVSDRGFKIDPSLSSQQKPSQKETPSLPETVEAKGKVLPDKVKNNGSETLSSAYIESVFLGRSALFRRCQLSSLRDNKLATGNMLFSLVIDPSGRVNNVKILQKNLNNTNLQNCVSSVIERTRFKSFQGTAISLSYPLNFQ